jgi:hypothetical protein
MGQKSAGRTGGDSGHSCAQSSLEGGVFACFFVPKM